MRACLCEQKSYSLEVLAICNAYTLSLGGVLLINLASSEYYCIYFTRLIAFYLTVVATLLASIVRQGFIYLVGIYSY